MTLALPYFAGMTWGWVGVRGTWNTPEARQSMQLMKERLAVNWTAITFSALQEHPQATEIKFREAPTVTDEEIIAAVHHAKELGLYTILKPVVNCADGTWRAHINFFDVDVPCEPKWSDWFASYNEFIMHYAKLAQQLKVDMFCVGCEMVQADRREQEWRNLIANVRTVYSGPITYNCDKYQETEVKWWDAVDVISSSGYYPIHNWTKELDRIEPVIQQVNKPFFFMEAGCPSREGSPNIPNDWGLKGAPSEQAQQDYYIAMFNAAKTRNWVRGFLLWDWPAKLYDESVAATNDDYCPYGKLAERTIKNFYLEQLIENNDAK